MVKMGGSEDPARRLLRAVAPLLLVLGGCDSSPGTTDVDAVNIPPDASADANVDAVDIPPDGSADANVDAVNIPPDGSADANVDAVDIPPDGGADANVDAVDIPPDAVAPDSARPDAAPPEVVWPDDWVEPYAPPPEVEVPPLPPSGVDQLPTDADGLATGFQADGVQLRFDPAIRDPITALGRCADLVSYCVRPPERTLDACVASARPCAGDRPWEEDAACCPAACQVGYAQARAGGLWPIPAFERVFFDEPTCFPGVVARLGGAP